MAPNTTSICLIGAGYISNIHAEAITQNPSLKLSAVLDVNSQAASALAAKWGVGHVFDSAEAAIASGSFSRAHVLVPPHLHRAIAEPFIKAGIPLLIEKPICATADECESLSQTIEASETTVGVNQNFIFHPAFMKMQKMLDARKYGRPRFISCLYNVSLRQLAAGQLGHWMFQQPLNMLLEQAVHPLSQIAAIAGDITGVKASAGQPVEIAPGVPFYDSAEINLQCTHIPAQLRFAVGQNFPFWQISAICDDGVITADILNNRCYAQGRVRWLEAVEQMLSGLDTAAQITGQSLRNLADYSLSAIKLKRNSSPFYQSMYGGIREFHEAVDSSRTPRCNASFGTKLVNVCTNIDAQIFTRANPAMIKLADTASGCDVAVLGGTGFIGRHVVKQLIQAGKRVSVMARSAANLPAIYHHANVTVVRGDVRSSDDAARGIADAPIVINLAHGGGGADWPAIQTAIVGSARIVAESCLAKGVKRLIHTGSIAGLYLGNPDDVITGATPPDPNAGNRGDYARGKAEADQMLLRMHREKRLPVCILRPGVVVGEGSPPFHSGLGIFNNDQHCIGWNAGANPLPFVLVEDTASAILAAVNAPEIEGKCYNLVGGAQLSAFEYIAVLGSAMERPLKFHSQSTLKLQAVEIAKWLIKSAAGRAAGFPSYYDLKSRGMVARFDCSDARRDLNWKPIDDREEFIRRAIGIFSPPAW